MKNLLVISDNFTRGGLETQIYSLYSCLKERINFCFAFGNYSENEWDFGSCPIYKGLKFNEESTVKDLKNTVEKIVNIINENKIDIIHVHPFFLSIPAVIASQIAHCPIYYSYHGFGSISFPLRINTSLFFDYSINELFSGVFISYKDVEKYYAKTLRNANTFFITNPIDLTLYKKSTVVKNGEWAFVTRIDIDKYDSIVDIVTNLNQIPIKKLHFFGDGDKCTDLRLLVSELSLNDKVVFHGFSKHIYKDLQQGYNGIIGMGRCAMEGIAMQLPVILTGYGKCFGLIDKDNYEIVRDNNFAPIFLNSKSYSEIATQISDMKDEYVSDIYEMFKKDCSSSEVSLKYYEEIMKGAPVTRSNVLYFWNNLLNVNEEDVFSSSADVFSLIHGYLKQQSLDLSFNSQVINYADLIACKSEVEAIKADLDKLRNSITLGNLIKASIKARLNKL